MNKTFYETLGVTPTTSAAEIKKAYTTLALKEHPDKGGDATTMALLTEAYKTLYDPEKRKRYNATLSVSLDSDSSTDPSEVMHLQAGDTPPFSAAYKEQHNQLVRQYARSPLAPYSASAEFQVFESNLYILETQAGKPPLAFHDVFSVIHERTKLGIKTSELTLPKASLTPVLAVQLFMEFLSGKYNLSQLRPLKDYFTAEIEKLKKTNTPKPELAFYQGMLDIMLITDLGPNTPYNTISYVRNITDLTKNTSDAVFSSILPLFYSQYFRNLYAYALHRYWQPRGDLFSAENLKAFDGRVESKELFEVLKGRLADESEDEHLISLTRYVKLLHNLEKAINESIETDQNASNYREKAFNLLDWMPALFGKANKKILINMFLQIGIKFQQASQKETQPIVRMADEQLALRMYLTCYTIGHENATPDEEMYANTEILKYVATFKFKDPILAMIIPALQKRVLTIADVFPFFNANQANISYVMHEYQSLYQLRRVLNGLVKILEYNYNHPNSTINIDHAPSSILYQAYEACLKNWYQEMYDPAVEGKFRRLLMGELLQEKGWIFDDVAKNLNSPWIMVARDNEGWMQSTGALPYNSDTKQAKYSAINGAEIDEATGEITFLMQEWTSNRPVYEKKFSLFDLDEMLAKNIGAAIFSLDPVDPNRPYHPFNALRFGPDRLYETELLNSMLLTDYVLKFLTTNQEVQGEYPFNQRPVDTMLQHLPGYLRKIVDDYQSSKQHSSALNRFWIEALQINITISDSDKTENKSTRFALGDVKMVVKKHRMERDVHGELKDVGNEDEGWPIYVLTANEMSELERGRRIIDGHAMIYIYAEYKLIYWENNKIVCTHVPQNYKETLVRIFKQPKSSDGKITQNSENAHLYYRSTREMAQQSGMSHRFSPEFIFAHEFTTHYDEFAQYLPEFGRLKELSKIAALIRYLDSFREHNSEQIQALNFILQPTLKTTTPQTDSYKNYVKVQQAIHDHVSSSFAKWRTDGLSTSGLKTAWRTNLSELRKEIGELRFGPYSTEVEEICQKYHTQLARDNPGIPSSRLWSEAINPKRSEFAQQLSTSKRDNVFNQLMELYQKKLSLYRTRLAQLVNSFLDGDSTGLVDELVKHDQAEIYPKLQAQLPNSTISDVGQAMDGNSQALLRIANNVSRNQLSEIKSEKDKLENGFVNIGLGTEEEPVSLDGKCLWVPASVRHEVHMDATSGLSRYSFFVYGGVNLQSQIKVVQGNGAPLSGSRVGSGTLANGNTYLYQKVSADGRHLKFGVTVDPKGRYTNQELNGGHLKILNQGARKEMLRLERGLHTKMPLGPEEKQRFYVKVQKDAGYEFPIPGFSYVKRK